MAAAQIAHTVASSQVRLCRSASIPIGITPIPPQIAMQNGISPRTWSDTPNCCWMPLTACANDDWSP